MAQYRDLNAPPKRKFAEIVAAMQDQAKSSKTGAHGVKDLGESGDVVWPRPDGTPVSVRDVDLELADARQRIEDAETSLSETGTRLTDAEQAVSDAVASIDGKLDESALDDSETSERLAASMTDVARHLIVTDSAILNHATLIGQTVVDDINVQGKLIGKDGVFTGTVDFENINVSDQVLAERLAGEHIYGTVVEGGEIRTTDGLPGQVILSDEGYVEPGSQTRRPGIRIIPPDSSGLATPPGIGPSETGFVITGGVNKVGGYGYSLYSPNQALMSFKKGSSRSTVAVSDQYAWVDAMDSNGNEGQIAAGPTFAQVKAEAADGTFGLIATEHSHAVVATVEPGGKYMSSVTSSGRSAFLRSNGSDGRGRILSVDSNGVWVKVQRDDGSGHWNHINLTGGTWQTLGLLNGWQAYVGGGGYYGGIRVQRTPLGIRLDGMIKSGGVGVVAVLPDDMQDVAAKLFTAPAAGNVSAFLEISTSPDHGNKYCLKYRSGPSAPPFVSVSTDAALL